MLLTARQWRQIWYLPVLALAMAMMMGRIMAMAWLLELPSFAAFNTGLLLSSTFCILGCLGLYSLLQRDMPILLARHRQRAAVVLMAQALLVAGGCAIAIMPLAAMGAAAMNATPGLAVLGVLHGLSQQLFLVATIESRSRGQALRYAWQNLARAGLVVGGGLLAAARTGSPEVVLASEAALSLLLTAGIVAKVGLQGGHSPKHYASLALRSWRRIAWPTAVVMLASSGVGFALISLDRWLAASWLSPQAFAHFTFAALVLVVAQAVQSMVNASAYPMIARRLALHGASAAFRLARTMSLLSIVVGLLLAWPAHIAAEFCIRRWFPVYEPAIGLLWPLIAAAVLRVSDYWTSFLIICNHERDLLKVQLAACLASSCAWLAAQGGDARFAPTAMDLCWLSLMLSGSSYLITTASAFALRPSSTTEQQ